MPIVVDARTPEDFNAWLAEKKQEAEKVRQLTQENWDMDKLMKLGKTTYDKICAACHQVGRRGNAAIVPSIKRSRDDG